MPYKKRSEADILAALAGHADVRAEAQRVRTNQIAAARMKRYRTRRKQKVVVAWQRSQADGAIVTL